MRRYRPLPAVVFAIIVSALVGGLFGRSALATDDKIPDHYRAFTAALSAIENSYVDKVESDTLVTGAIRGMLGTLDPHSSYFTPKEYAQMRERQEGRYYGIGVSIVAVDGDITAVTVFEGSPAYKKGIRSGDVIAKVNTKDAKGWTTEQAMRELRGPRGTTVDVEIRRRGYEALIPFQLTRDEVYIPTVPAYFMIDSTTGYIRMQDFGENTDRDVKHALHDLTSKGMRRLLFDIRNNPGGPLDQAIQVANEFLPRTNDRVHARPHRELGSGLPGEGRRRVHRHSDRAARQPQQRERIGNRHRRAPGSRSRVRRRRDDVRQGARSVRVPHQRGRGSRADHRSLLHAERPAHPASVGCQLRRVSELWAEGSVRSASARGERVEAH